MEKKAPSGNNISEDRTRKMAIGSLADAPAPVAKALQVIIPKFNPLEKPGPNDWLSSHNEKGQTYDFYKREKINWINAGSRDTIYIMVLEADIDKTFISNLEKFCRAFYFGLKVKTIYSEKDLSQLEATNRINPYTNKIQYHGENLLSKIEKMLPSDAYCMLGVMMKDLYPSDSWNYAFGYAWYKRRAGVFSFIRYDENFFEDKEEEDAEKKKANQMMLLKRSGKIMCHEMGHMFGLQHCIYFNCLMNGINHLEENDKKPMEFCPVCIRKLQENIKFPMLERYEALLNLCTEFGPFFNKERLFYSSILEDLKSSKRVSVHSVETRSSSKKMKSLERPQQPQKPQGYSYRRSSVERPSPQEKVAPKPPLKVAKKK